MGACRGLVQALSGGPWDGFRGRKDSVCAAYGQPAGFTLEC